MIQKIQIERLTQDTVTIITRQYTIIDGVEYELGTPFGKGYRNTEQGRSDVIDELPEHIHNAVLAMWGDNPTITDEE